MTANSAAVVRTQAELDEALAANTGLIEIRSPAGVWLTVMATGSSTVTATDSSTVRAYGSSTVTASPCVAVHLHSGLATIDGGVVIDVTTVSQLHCREMVRPPRCRSHRRDRHRIQGRQRPVDHSARC